MTIFSIKSPKKAITRLRHRDTYDQFKSNMTDEEFEGIMAALNLMIAQFPEGQQVTTASYIPGDDWTGTLFQPIFTACKGDLKVAKSFFAQLIWVAFQKHSDDWMFLRKNSDEDQLLGVTYFKKQY